MTEKEMSEEQYEELVQEHRRERDDEMRGILRMMSTMLSRGAVDFPLPWAVDAAKQVEEFDDDKEAEQ